MKPDSISLDIFQHVFDGEVKFSEVDSFGVVHNLAYLYWIEWARTQYLFDVASTKHSAFFTSELPLMTVATQIDYMSALHFADQYAVLTRVKSMGTSSVTFENVTIEKYSKRIVNVASSTLVYVDSVKQAALPFPDLYKSRILEFEQKVSSSNSQADSNPGKEEELLA